jgi:protein TonB
MKKNILLSGVTAVAIHALILSAPLSETKHNRTPGQIYEPISIRIISPQKTTAAAPPVQAPLKPRLAAKDIPLKKSSPEEATKSELTANSSNQNKLVKVSFPDRMRKDQTKKIETTPPVKTASTAGHILRKREESIGTSQGKRAAQGNIVYARPKYKQNPTPHYPELAKRRGYEGKTLLKVKVLENGKAGNIQVEESSGFKVLDTAALRSVRGWTFVPGTINGKRTEQWIRVPIRFVLK